ncbi:MAG: C2H2-type zinc finger protein [Thermoplasmata archaeon]
MPYIEYDEIEAICSECGRIFRSEEALGDHRKEAHQGGTDSAVVSVPASVKCSMCGRTFGSVDALRRHTQSHHNR